jgi:hypothetical protein
MSLNQTNWARQQKRALTRGVRVAGHEPRQLGFASLTDVCSQGLTSRLAIRGIVHPTGGSPGPWRGDGKDVAVVTKSTLMARRAGPKSVAQDRQTDHRGVVS